MNDYNEFYKKSLINSKTGHIGVSVPDVDDACRFFASMGVEFVKKPEDGKMKGIAFIKDPDGYWIEIFSPRNISNIILGQP